MAGLKEDLVCFCLSFFNFGNKKKWIPNTKKTDNQNIYEAFKQLFSAPRELAHKKTLKQQWHSVWTESVPSPRSLSLCWPSVETQWRFTSRCRVDTQRENRKAEGQHLDEPASRNCIFSHRVYNSHGKCLHPDSCTNNRWHLSSRGTTLLKESFNYYIGFF